jgi:hypothetical protein
MTIWYIFVAILVYFSPFWFVVASIIWQPCSNERNEKASNE